MSNLRYLQNVVTLQLDVAKCIGCGMCAAVCPHGVLEVQEHRARLRDRDACIECGACARNCPVAALAVQAGVGCASAIIHSWLTGAAPSCDCGGSC
jgi:ferredoxin